MKKKWTKGRITYLIREILAEKDEIVTRADGSKCRIRDLPNVRIAGWLGPVAIDRGRGVFLTITPSHPSYTYFIFTTTEDWTFNDQRAAVAQLYKLLNKE